MINLFGAVGASLFLTVFATQVLALSAHHAKHAPPIRHVFLIILENKSYTDTFFALSRETAHRKGVALPAIPEVQDATPP